MYVRFAVVAMFLLPTLAAAQNADPCAQSPTTCATLINTHATSRTRIPNTVVDISVAITASDKDLPSVQRALGSKSGALLSYLRTQQVQRLITTNVSFRPDTRYEKNGPNKTVGYDGASRISFRTTPDKAPDILAGCLANGATSIDRTSFTPTEEETAAARRQLSADATKAALAQADSIASAGGMHIVSIRQIDMENDDGTLNRSLNGLATNSMLYMDGFTGHQVAKARLAPPDTETSAGEQDLSITVNVVAAATH